MDTTSFYHWVVSAFSIGILIAWYQYYRSYARLSAVLRTMVPKANLSIPIIFLIPFLNIPTQLRIAFRTHNALNYIYGSLTQNTRRNRYLGSALLFITCQCLLLVPSIFIPACIASLLAFTFHWREVAYLSTKIVVIERST